MFADIVVEGRPDGREFALGGGVEDSRGVARAGRRKDKCMDWVTEEQEQDQEQEIGEPVGMDNYWNRMGRGREGGRRSKGGEVFRIESESVYLKLTCHCCARAAVHPRACVS